ncbi:hypothetical protein OH492_12135 [Vibrio chagasii]|nr:hypothetical protein [Vibrio chagasii]
MESLRAQDHLYTVAEKGAESTNVKVIGSVTESLHPSLDGIETVLEKMKLANLKEIGYRFYDHHRKATALTLRQENSTKIIH